MKMRKLPKLTPNGTIAPDLSKDAKGNVIIRRGVTDPAGGVPDYNARVAVEKL